jgi:DNA-binding transcriptional LysR family regulator
MDLRQLRFFVAIAEERNFTRAAERLHIAQPAVSVAIRNLEEQLGLSLFSREGKKVTLTAEGEVFLGHAREILARVHNAEREMGEMRGLEMGQVRIGVPAQLGSYYFPQLLFAFKQRYPKLRCGVYEYGTRRIGELLSKGALELGVVTTSTAPADLEVRPFLQEEMVACVPADHPFARQATVSHQEFAAQPLVLFERNYFHREVISQTSEHSGTTPSIVFETNLIPLIKYLVRKGVGITTLLRRVIQEEPDLVGVPFVPPISFELAIAWEKDSSLSKANQAFVDFLLSQERVFQEDG